MLDFLMIAVICVCVIDETDFIESINQSLSKWLGVRASIKKPFNCSLCCTWWIGLVWMICNGGFSLMNIMILLLIAIATPLIKELIELINDLFVFLMRKIEDLIG